MYVSITISDNNSTMINTMLDRTFNQYTSNRERLI